MNLKTFITLGFFIFSILIANHAVAEVCSRTPQVKVALEEVIKKPCAEIGASDLALVQNLNLQGQSIISLGSSDFFGLNNLQTLDLANNKLTTFPSDVFKGLNYLQFLSLFNNRLTALPIGGFEGLNDLQNLDLTYNKLTSLPVDVFKGLNKLKYLSLFSNQLTALPSGVFEGLYNLQTLVLSINHLSTIKTGIFSDLLNIQNIDLRGNQISAIEDKPFGLKPFKRCQQILVEINNNLFAVFPSDKLPKFANPYQCPVLPLSDSDSILDQIFHLTLTRLDMNAPTFTQIEQVVPLLESAFIRDYPQMPITAHYGFDLIPTLDGTVGGLHIVRQLAVDVCALVERFCPIREEIHQYPRLSHLTATTDLKNELIAQNAPHETIDKVTELERSLLQMFSRDLNYEQIRTKLPEGPLKQSLDQLFSQASWSFEDISKAVFRINSELTQAHDSAWMDKHFVAFFKVKSFLIYTFKKNFWNTSTQELVNVKTVQSLLDMSQGVALLSEKEARFLKLAIERGDDLQKIIEKSIAWQLKNLEREHFSQVTNQAYTPVSPDLPDPNLVLEPLYQKIVRTSLIAEWDRLK